MIKFRSIIKVQVMLFISNTNEVIILIIQLILLTYRPQDGLMKKIEFFLTKFNQIKSFMNIIIDVQQACYNGRLTVVRQIIIVLIKYVLMSVKYIHYLKMFFV